MSMVNIFEYMDYRQYLKDYYEHEKKAKPFFSYRYLSGRVKINPGYLVKLFQGKIHLGVKNIPAFADVLNLKDKEREYFIELVHFGRAKHENEIERRFERLQSIKGINFRTIGDTANVVEFYSKWYHMAIRSIISINPFDGKNFKTLSSFLTPYVSVKEVRDSIKLLERLEMIRKDADGMFRVTEQFISTGQKWTSAVILAYQRRNIELAMESLDRHEKELRDISSVTMTFPRMDMEALRERIRQFRQEILLMSKDAVNDDSVMQLNIQMFPVALVTKKTL
jgi:uncharacterized protein (TIGR02147 family)